MRQWRQGTLHCCCINVATSPVWVAAGNRAHLDFELVVICQLVKLHTQARDLEVLCLHDRVHIMCPSRLSALWVAGQQPGILWVLNCQRSSTGQIREATNVLVNAVHISASSNGLT